MADIADVLDALEKIALAAVFPNGTDHPSVSNTVVSVGQGWPPANLVNAAMPAGQSLVSIYAVPSSTSKLPVPLAVLGGEFAVSPGVLGRIIDRQRQNVALSVWAPNPSDRAVLGRAIDVAIKQYLTLPLQDTTTAILVTQTTNLIDKYQEELAYRRDLIVSCQWDTIETLPGVAVTKVNVQPKSWPLSP